MKEFKSKPVKGLTDLNDSKHSLRTVQAQINGRNNVKSGHLQSISKKGGKTQGNNNVSSGHLDKLNKSLTSEMRSKNGTTKIPLDIILEAQINETSPSKVAKKIGISPVTYRKLCKGYGIYKPYVVPKFDCIHCGKKNIDNGNYHKSHGDKCKQKDKNNSK